MRPRVLKFGGTSVGSGGSLARAVDIVESAARERPVVVVVSALSGVTNALEAALAGASARRLDVGGFVATIRERHLSLLRQAAGAAAGSRAAAAVEAGARELRRRLGETASAGSVAAPGRAAVLALGERLSAPVFAAALGARGLDARALDAAGLVRTDDRYAEAEVDLAATRQLTRAALRALPQGAVPVITGFIGATGTGATTVLGRGASDLTAAVVGWAIGAERVEIWSDVDGVMSADPRTEPDARTLPYLTYAQAAALARAGAKVLHPRTLEPLQPAGIPVFVGNTLRPGPGTWIGPAAA
ncbi:MAG TPA: aspartate kinase [Vicinamibacteria bacterium]|nr:aspartate kinase [Vicinamibacteria bacterium]